ncbi:ABC transporter ATP-binding protein [Natranaerobius thermophilus]|uniref:ABC transporter related n=1 Tax=Natranaerobius thermophilus (strain ATCC BAA-1301 / DSM 18059 / JW/NM-WN-LF) TaxID=457570 RepID=B2A0L1_NATTJ|nr:ABC transporter ATP-binding protein [Natranaerobius thermophilus]ACB84572.1 ABC transporter related [Natranaerobius thermophilus JW/NM-WN-LF]
MIKSPIINVKNLTKKYKEFTAVNNISFQVHAGEIFGFLGPNGAGKSSTINMLTGLAHITSGEYNVLGYSFDNYHKQFKKVMGVVPDESNMYDELTGFENLCFSGSLYGVDRDTRTKRAHNLLKKFKLENSGDKLFRYYSKGMKRKLTIAAALIHEPKILFLDEPTTGIDVQSAREIRSLIKDLNNDGKTIFLTTHYIEEAERLCHRIAFIVNGQIVKSDHTNNLLSGEKQGKTLELTVDKTVPELQEKLITQFPNLDFKVKSETSIIIESHKSGSITLYPYIHFLYQLGINVIEAKEKKLSLEEVFVRITGIESDAWTANKKGEEPA